MRSTHADARPRARSTDLNAHPKTNHGRPQAHPGAVHRDPTLYRRDRDVHFGAVWAQKIIDMTLKCGADAADADAKPQEKVRREVGARHGGVERDREVVGGEIGGTRVECDSRRDRRTDFGRSAKGTFGTV